MPGIDGATAAQLMHTPTGRNAGTPIVAFTAEASASPPPWRGIFDGVLQKPIVSRDLLAQLASLRAEREADISRHASSD